MKRLIIEGAPLRRCSLLVCFSSALLKLCLSNKFHWFLASEPILWNDASLFSEVLSSHPGLTDYQNSRERRLSVKRNNDIAVQSQMAECQLADSLLASTFNFSLMIGSVRSERKFSILGCQCWNFWHGTSCKNFFEVSNSSFEFFSSPVH